MQPPTRWVYEWQDPYFYTMLVCEWQTTWLWTGQTLQDYKAELLRLRGLNVMFTAEYKMVSQMGVFSFLQRHWCIQLVSMMSITEPVYVWLHGICINFYTYAICMDYYSCVSYLYGAAITHCSFLVIICIDMDYSIGHAKMFIELAKKPTGSVNRTKPFELASGFRNLKPTSFQQLPTKPVRFTEGRW
jgi:hypothetical protein